MYFQVILFQTNKFHYYLFLISPILTWYYE